MGNFQKLRKPNNSVGHEIFNHPQCVWANANSDRSNSYIIPKDILDNVDIPNDLMDRRTSTLEDLFIYYFNNLNEKDDDEIAA